MYAAAGLARESFDNLQRNFPNCEQIKMSGERKYLYGPVPSRRLGRSLGVDIVPFKVCTLDCVYCQLGKTIDKTIERGDYGPIEPILSELKTAIDEGVQADFITIAGSGEPTLNSRLGVLIEEIKKITNISVAVLTNGTLFFRQDVRADCARADVVMPSLDAGDEQTFNRINRPHHDINIKNVISGLSKFREEFTGKIWLEILFVEGINTNPEQITGIKEAIAVIGPDKVHLNTAVRPAAEPGIRKLDEEKLMALSVQLGHNCEVIADFLYDRDITAPVGCRDVEGSFDLDNKADIVLSMLKRRPCSLKDICSGLDIGPNEAIKYIDVLQYRGIICTEQKDGKIFYKILS